MKKLCMCWLFLVAPVAIFGQLKVDTDGRTSITYQNTVARALVSAGDGTTFPFSSEYRFGVYASSNYGDYSIGAKGSAWTTTERAIGLQGLAGSSNSGNSFGVIGGLNDNNYNGAGVFGTISNHTGIGVGGRYAGYFDGPVYMNNTATIVNLITPSDMRLKENVTSISENDEEETLPKLLAINVIKYTYKDRIVENSDTATFKTINDTIKDVHYGLSAQELMELYPELVCKGQDGYYGVKYMELVPVLIRSIQELKQELDEVKGGGSDMKARTTDSGQDGTTAIDDATSIPIVATLAQNTPNPFSERTTIRFTLPEKVLNAYIYIFDMSGKMQKQIPVDSSMQSVTIEGYELSAGMYIYSLVIGGKEIDTKRMIISK